MKYIKKINEAFRHKWRESDKLISSIWNITEDELFDDLSDLEDEFEVEIKCSFLLKSPKDSIFKLKDNEEQMEGFAAANFLPLINIEISTRDDIREVQSVMMDCLINIDGYYLYEISKNINGFKIKMAQEGEKDIHIKSGYHKKGNAQFSSLFTEIKNRGYKVIINKLFEENKKFFIKNPSTRSEKLYSIVIEKMYKTDLNMIDDLAFVKNLVLNCMQTLSKSNEYDDIYDMSCEFSLKSEGSNNGVEKSRSIFIIAAYER